MVTTTVTPTYTLEQAENDIAALRGQVDALDEYAEVGTLVGSIVAVQPGSNTTPATQEAPNTLSPGNGWSGSLRYWMNPNNTVHISVSNMTAGSPANGVTIATLPSLYRPSATRGFPVGCAIANANINPAFTITSGGVIQSSGVGASSTGVYAEVDIPLV